MDTQLVALIVLVAVLVLAATRVVHRAVASAAGALVLALFFRWDAAEVVPEVLLVTAGLMIVAGFVKRSGLASWLALKAAKTGKGRPGPILALTGVLAFVTGALLGPTSVILVVPVCLVLAAELDMTPLPFIVVLSWSALLGGVTTMTALPSSLWLASALGIQGGGWLLRVLPLTGTALVVTLLFGVLVFRKKLRVTNERRARILEYDESLSLGDRPLLIKTLTALTLVVLGLVFGPWLSLSPSMVLVGAAVVLLAWDRANVDKSLAELDWGTLLFFTGMFVVISALSASGLGQIAATSVPAHPLLFLWGTAVLGSFLDPGALTVALVPILKAWPDSGVWPFVVIGSAVGAGVTAWAGSSASALGLVGQRSRSYRRDFFLYGLLFAAVNLIAISALAMLGR